MTPCRLVLLLGAYLTAVSAPAAELVMEDLTLAVQAGPSQVTASVDNGSRSTTVDDGFAQAYGLRVGLRHAFSRPGGALAPLLGAELTVNRGVFQDGSSDERGGVLLGPGVGWAAFDTCTFFMQGVVGVGLERTTLTATPAYNALVAEGWWWSSAVRVGALVNLDQRWLIGLEGEYGAAPGSVSGDGLDLTIRPAGVSGALVLVWRMDASPAVLEQ